MATLCTYATLAGLDDGENAERFLMKSVRALSKRSMDASLHGGFTGIAWATAHLRVRLLGSDDADAYRDISLALHDLLSSRSSHEGFDLISGLVGIGVFAFERVPRQDALSLLMLVVDRLEDAAERTPEGVTWLTPLCLLPDWQRSLCPDGHYDLGVAHGVPGVIGLLGYACRVEETRGKAKPLLEGAVRWLLSQRSSNDRAESSFQSWVIPRSRRSGPALAPCRLAWCYGDAGVAATLLGAARALGRPAWERVAVDIACRAAGRTLGSAGVVDAGLCHGAAGLGHIFNRLYQATGHAALREASLAWFRHLLNMRRPKGGLAGFLTFDPTDARQPWTADAGLLGGATGVALALLSATAPIEPSWDRVLLLSPLGDPR